MYIYFSSAGTSAYLASGGFTNDPEDTQLKIQAKRPPPSPSLSPFTF